MTHTKKHFRLIPFLICVSHIGISCHSDLKKTTLPLVLAEKEYSSSTIVETARAVKRPFLYLLSANGKIRSLSEELINAPANGRVVISNAITGSHFDKGALIAQLETITAELKLERAQLSRFNAEKEYESQLLGYRTLIESKDSSKAAAIKMKLRISSGLSSAEQDIKEANYELSRCYIKAPFPCRLSDVKILGQQDIKEGQELFRIYDYSNLVLEMKILESDISLCRKGMQAAISPIGNPGKKYVACVYDINPYVDDNGMVTIRLKIITGGQELFPGMNCTAEIKIPKESSVVVPREAIVLKNDKPVVFVLNKGLAEWHYVVLGKENSQEVEIVNGLHGGEKVITSNNLQLSHEAPVKEKQTDTTQTQSL